MIPGMTGILAPPNLATNGGFGIHQRGGHNWSPLKGGDYVADCWQVHTHTDVEYLEVWHGVPTDGSVNKPIYRGYGKKGQEINIKCRDVDPYGEHYGMFTSQVTIEKYSAVKSVPLKVDCFPKRDHSYSTVLNESKILGGANNSVSTVTIVDAPASDGLMYGGFVRVYLQEDGEFSFIIMNYMELAGAFKNPPKYAPVPYADDLARCQRYYQERYLNSHSLSHPHPVFHMGGVTRVVHQFPIQPMASTPSISLIRHSESVHELTTSSNSGNTNNFSTLYPSVSTRIQDGNSCYVSIARSSQSTSVTGMIAAYSVNLEVV